MNAKVQNKFSEKDFVGILFSLLCQNGVYSIEQDELVKKLFYYYNDFEYKELFENINVKEDEIDISKGLHHEKFFTGRLLFDTASKEKLVLNYSSKMNLSLLEKYLSIDGKKAIRKLAMELSTIYKLEKNSTHKAIVLNNNPNVRYTIFSGKSLNSNVGFELITDGKIEDIDYFIPKRGEKKLFPSTVNINEYIFTKNNKMVYVKLKNASYSIEQAICNNLINYFIINTKNMDEKFLEKLILIGNTKYDEEYKVTDNEPFVRKLTL